MTTGAYGVQDSAKVVPLGEDAAPHPSGAAALARDTVVGPASMKLFDLLSAQRRFVYLAIALVSAAGIWAGAALPSAIYPELVFPRVTIIVEGSTLSTRQVVFAITRPIEEAVSIVPGVQRVRSSSIRGASEINVFFGPSTDMAYALQQVQARVNQVRPQLPPDPHLQVERLTASVFPILSYNLEGGDAAALYDMARYQIKPVLSRIPGVGRVDAQGSDVREIEVIADPVRLAAQGMTYADLATAIRRGSTVEAVGRVSQSYKQYLVLTDHEAHTVDDIANIVISSGLRVRDLATVMAGTEDHVRIIAGDGRPAAVLNVTRQVVETPWRSPTASPAWRPPSLARCHPASISRPSRSGGPGARRRDLGTRRDANRGRVGRDHPAVFLRHARITAISANSIPLTLAITVFVMSLLGQTFNLMTLGAMAIAIGLVIDDAVVITENVVRHLQLSTSRTMAIREAVQELIRPVTNSTITTVVVLPLGLLEGVVGQFFKALSITLTIAVLVSLILALTIRPLLSEQFLQQADAEAAPAEAQAGDVSSPRGLLRRLGKAVDGIADAYEHSLGRLLRHPRRVLAVGALLIVLGVLVYRLLGTGFLPEMDRERFVPDYWTPGGTSLAESDRMVHVAENVLAAEPEISRHITSARRRAGAVRDAAESRRHGGPAGAAGTARPLELRRDGRCAGQDQFGRATAADRIHADPVRRDQ